MSAAFLLGLANTRQVVGFEWMADYPLLQPRQLVYVGVRDLDEPEKNLLKHVGIRTYTMRDVDHLSVAQISKLVLQYLEPYEHLHLSFDIDSIDPVYAPATGTPVVGGLTPREAHYLLEKIAQTGKLRCMDMVEVNPMCAPDTQSRMTAELAADLICTSLGATIL